MNKSNLKLEEVKKDDLYLTENKGISEPLEKDDFYINYMKKILIKLKRFQA